MRQDAGLRWNGFLQWRHFGLVVLWRANFSKLSRTLWPRKSRRIGNPRQQQEEVSGDGVSRSNIQNIGKSISNDRTSVIHVLPSFKSRETIVTCPT
jgi:hypothetical protein